ncbi:MAG: hypothetical protein PHI12_07615 [Dehalococcoidales bacterium]|nr:hypothetical protein [Dehalococcoidales bacterium]
MVHILMTPENKKVAINIDTDACLFDAPHNPPNTGTRYTSGVDLYAHKARSGKLYFYTYSWSMWQGTESNFHLISDEEAKQFLLEKAGYANYGLSPGEREGALGFFPNLFDEDA